MNNDEEIAELPQDGVKPLKVLLANSDRILKRDPQHADALRLR